MPVAPMAANQTLSVHLHLRAGAKVAVCELPFGYISSDSVGGAGGTCVLRGCVPKKLMVYAAGFPSEFAESHGFGWGFLTEKSSSRHVRVLSENHRVASADFQLATGVQLTALKDWSVTSLPGCSTVTRSTLSHSQAGADCTVFCVRSITLRVRLQQPCSGLC